MKSLYKLIIILFVFTTLQGNSQENQLKLSLEEVVDLALKQSIDAFRNENMFRARYWEYRYYKADLLPRLDLSATPVEFSRYQKREYNFQTNEEEFVRRETMASDFNLSLNQNIPLTGGKLFLSSDLGVVKNLSGDKSTSFMSTPISIGYTQALNGYNKLKWKSKIEPLKYEKAKKEMIQSNEELALKANKIFFNLVSAQISLSIAEYNLSNNDTIYRIGKGRFQVGTVTQNELLNQELNLLNAKQAQNKARLELVRARTEMNSFLGLDKNSTVVCILPSQIPNLKVDANVAIEKAMENNPEILHHRQQLLQQDEYVTQAKSEAGFNTNIFAQYGLDQAAPEFKNVYTDPDVSQRFRLGVSIPIVDWGRRKGKYLMAESDREVERARIRQAQIDFEQDVFQTVMEFNLQEDQVSNAALADTVAQKGYEVTFQRFLIGKVDNLSLNQARKDLEDTKKAYILALQAYWGYYYTVRKLTLFNFEGQEDLSVGYDKILENDRP